MNLRLYKPSFWPALPTPGTARGTTARNQPGTFMPRREEQGPTVWRGERTAFARVCGVRRGKPRDGDGVQRVRDSARGWKD